jgi:DNA-binding MarR family transcriptional regulator
MTSAPPAPSADDTAATLLPRGCSNFKLRQAARVATRHYEAYLAPVGLKITQYSLLSHVLRLGPLRASELAAAMQLSPSALTRNLQPLIEQGWVTQHADTSDARAQLLHITPAGRRLRDRAQRAWKEAQQAFNTRLGPERVVLLHRLLDDAVALLGGGEDAPA